MHTNINTHIERTGLEPVFCVLQQRCWTKFNMMIMDDVVLFLLGRHPELVSGSILSVIHDAH